MAFLILCGLSFEYTVLRLVTARNRCHFDDTSARTVRLHTEQIATPLTIITTPPNLICLSIYVHPFRPIVCKEGRKNTRRSCWERSFFFAVRIKLAKPSLSQGHHSSHLFNFLCQQRKLQRNCIALEKGLLSTAITQILFQRRWLCGWKFRYS